MYLRWSVDSIIPPTTQGKDPMRPHRCLLPENMCRTGGIGPMFDLGSDCGKLLVVTLAIDQVVEQGGLIISIWGSEDGTDWGMKPLVSFPEKYYCGLYSQLLNLAMRPETRYLRVQWSMRGWGKTNRLPLFSFELYLEESGSRITTAVA